MATIIQKPTSSSSNTSIDMNGNKKSIDDNNKTIKQSPINKGMYK